MSRIGAAPRAAVPLSNARVEASRRMARSRAARRRPKARRARRRMPWRHGPAGAEVSRSCRRRTAPSSPASRRRWSRSWRRSGRSRRCSRGASRSPPGVLARADRIEIELFEERGWHNASPGLALIRDGNGTRSFETLLRYRGAAMAEFWRALKTPRRSRPKRRSRPSKRSVTVPPWWRARSAPRRGRRSSMPSQPNEPERAPPDRNTSRASRPRPAPCTSPPHPWLPNEPESVRHAASLPASSTNPKAHPAPTRPRAGGKLRERGVPCIRTNPMPRLGTLDIAADCSGTNRDPHLRCPVLEHRLGGSNAALALLQLGHGWRVAALGTLTSKGSRCSSAIRSIRVGWRRKSTVPWPRAQQRHAPWWRCRFARERRCRRAWQSPSCSPNVAT